MGIRDIDLTPELKEKMRKFRPIPITNTFDYIPKVFRDMPIDLQPVFKLKHLDGIDMMRSVDSLWHGGVGELNFTRGQYVIYVCERGILGWDGYFDVKYEGRASIGRLPPELLSELCDAIDRKDDLEEEEKLGLK